MKIKCLICNKIAAELCGDDVCRACHIKTSFEDCLDGVWESKMEQKYMDNKER